MPLEVPMRFRHLANDPLSRKGGEFLSVQQHPGTADDHLGVRSAGRENPPFASLSLSSRSPGPPLGGSSDLQRGFLTGGPFVFLHPPLPVLPAELELGRMALPTLSFASPKPPSLSSPSAEEEPERCVVCRMWRWAFSSSILHPAVPLGPTSGHL